MATNGLSRSARVVQEALERKGLPCEVRELPDTTRSARDAAKAIGCDVAEIAKSLIFRNIDNDTAVLVIASGTNRVDEQAIARVVGSPIEMASPAFVLEKIIDYEAVHEIRNWDELRLRLRPADRRCFAFFQGGDLWHILAWLRLDDQARYPSLDLIGFGKFCKL